MNDITALMATMKASAARAAAAISDYDRGRIDVLEKRLAVEEYEKLVSEPANVLALVEALEKAQAAMTAVVAAASIRGIRPFDGVDCDTPTLEENAEACGDAMSARVRELEANPPKPHHNGLMQLSNELVAAKHRIAMLESRTVTVKLPEYAEHDVTAPVAAYLSEKFGWDGGVVRWDGRKEYDVLSDRVKYALKMVCRRAGINVEAE